MKKAYQKPAVQVFAIETSRFIAGSEFDTHNPVSADQALGRRGRDWDDDDDF
jgi:hypothetical protein